MQFTFSAYRQDTDFDQIFAAGREGRLIHGLAYTQVDTISYSFK